MLLSDEPDMEVVGEAGDGAKAFDLAMQLRPHVVLADITMPPPDGLELTRQLRAALPDTGTVIVSMRDDPAIINGAFEAGAAGYVVKRGAPLELIDAIRAVVDRHRKIDSSP
jgi:two-component system, NarL family, response regulator NreC